MNQLRVMIAGAGMMGRWHADAAARAGGRILGVADRDLPAAQRLAARYHARAYAQAETMIAAALPKAPVQVLHICTPLETHGALAEQALRAGVNVLAEKPLTADATETERLLALAEESKVLLAPVHQFVFQPGVVRAFAQLAEGRIGQLLHVDLTFCSAGAGEGPAPLLDRIAGDILPHPLSLLCRLPLTGPDENMSGFQVHDCVRPRSGELRVALRGCGAARGVTVALTVSMNARPTRCALSLLGTKGALHVNLFHGYCYAEAGTVSRVRKIVAPFDVAARGFSAAAFNLARRAASGEAAYPGLRRLTGEFYQAVRSGRAAPLDCGEILSVARARDQIIRAAFPPGGAA